MRPDEIDMKQVDMIRNVWEHFKLQVFRCERIQDTSANVYCLCTDSGSFALKEYPSGTKYETIELETEVCAFLNGKGYTVPKHLIDREGHKIVTFENRYFTVYSWIPGKRQPFHSGTQKQSVQCAELYGRLVHSLKDFPRQLTRKESFNRSRDSIDQSICQHQALISVLDDVSVKEELQTKVELLYRLKEERWEGFEFITWAKSHGDYSSYQILFDGENISGLLDFTSLREMPVIFELFRSFLYLSKGFEEGLPDMPEFAEYLKKYEKFEKLNTYDIQFAVRCYYLRILKSVFGYQQYSINPRNHRYLHLGQELYKQCILIRDNERQLTTQLYEAMYG